MERPRLISKWLEMAFCARSAAMLAPYDLLWPQDLMEDFMAGQRAAPNAVAASVAAVGRGRQPAAGSTAAASADGGNVIALRPRNRRG